MTTQWKILTLTLTLFLFNSLSASTEDLKSRLIQYFHDIIENPTFDQELLEHYVSKEYTQVIDGQKCDYTDFVDHLRFLKQSETSTTVTTRNLIREENKVGSLHQINIVKEDGKESKIQVIALFEFEGDKLIYCHELTQLIK